MTKKLDEALAKIKKVLEKRPEVLAAYLFGSQAKGYAREDSDVDVAVMMMPDFAGDSYNYQFDLESEVAKVVPEYKKVDTVLLNNMGYPLKYNSTIKGVLFYSRDDIKRAREEVMIQNIREDFGDFFSDLLEHNLEGAREYLEREGRL